MDRPLSLRDFSCEKWIVDRQGLQKTVESKELMSYIQANFELQSKIQRRLSKLNPFSGVATNGIVSTNGTANT